MSHTDDTVIAAGQLTDFQQLLLVRSHRLFNQNLIAQCHRPQQGLKMHPVLSADEGTIRQLGLVQQLLPVAKAPCCRDIVETTEFLPPILPRLRHRHKFQLVGKGQGIGGIGIGTTMTSPQQDCCQFFHPSS